MENIEEIDIEVLNRELVLLHTNGQKGIMMDRSVNMIVYLKILPQVLFGLILRMEHESIMLC